MALKYFNVGSKSPSVFTQSIPLWVPDNISSNFYQKYMILSYVYYQQSNPNNSLPGKAKHWKQNTAKDFHIRMLFKVMYTFSYSINLIEQSIGNTSALLCRIMCKTLYISASYKNIIWRNVRIIAKINSIIYSYCVGQNSQGTKFFVWIPLEGKEDKMFCWKSSTKIIGADFSRKFSSFENYLDLLHFSCP